MQRLNGEAMKKGAFYKDIRRTLKKNLSRFIAITVMAALGIGVFSGFAVGCLDALKSADKFFHKQNTYDIKIVSTLGLTRDDVLAISKVKGVSSVFGSPSMDVKVQQSSGSLLMANLSTLDTKGMNKPYEIEGELPTKSGQIAVNSKFMEDTGLKLGDSITLTEDDADKTAIKDSGSGSGEKDDKADLGINIESDTSAPSLSVKNYKITAIILSPLDISNTKKGIASVSFSSSNSNYMMYATADCIKSDIYSSIYVTLKGASKLDGYSKEYQTLVDNMTSKIKSTIQEKRQQARYDEVVGNANAKIIKAEALLRDKMAEAEQKLSNDQKKIDEGQAELNKNKSDYQNSIANARQKLSDAKNKVSDISMAKWYVWDRSYNESIAGLKSDVSFIQAVTKAFPVIFFLVAVLISLTTMTRMVEEDRGLIGTYKSLGYSNFQISIKYILYAVLACIIGGILGSILGFVALPKVIEVVTSTLYSLPKFQLFFNPYYGIGGFGMFLLGIAGATAISCAEMLRHRPAELMRPKAPKTGSRILLEYIPFIWKRLNFLNKVTCRNLFRYKKRAIMTIVGISGCTMLIVLGFGLRDSVVSLTTDQFNRVTVYDAIVMTDNLNTAKMNTLANEWKASGKVKDTLQLQIKSLTLRNKRDSLDITVMVIPEGSDLGHFVNLYDSKTHKSITLPKNGIVVTQNAAKKLALTSGDTVSMQNENNLERDFRVSYVSTNYTGNYVYVSESYYQAAFGDYNGTSFLLNLTNKKEDQKWLDTLSDDERILKVNSSQSMMDAFSKVNNVINMVVYLLIGMSAVLALTVLFTLSNINISERERELATIKVLGFRREEVYSYVNRETFILTLLGIICGLPAGFGITYGILSNVTIANISFKVRVSIISYLIAAVITLVFALLVNKVTNKDLRKINMVEALKSVE